VRAHYSESQGDECFQAGCWWTCSDRKPFRNTQKHTIFLRLFSDRFSS
jgi:hypothetical protein